MEEHDFGCYRKFFPGFKLLFTPAKRVSVFGRASGGCLYGFKNLLDKSFRLKFCSSLNLNFLSIRNKLLSVDLVPIYINCNKWNEDFIELQEGFGQGNLGSCILIGDVNARTGTLQVCDLNSFFNSDMFSNTRSSKDRVVNMNGRKIVEFLDDNGLVILNGRNGD